MISLIDPIIRRGHRYWLPTVLPRGLHGIGNAFERDYVILTDPYKCSVVAGDRQILVIITGNLMVFTYGGLYVFLLFVFLGSLPPIEKYDGCDQTENGTEQDKYAFFLTNIRFASAICFVQDDYSFLLFDKLRPASES